MAASTVATGSPATFAAQRGGLFVPLAPPAFPGKWTDAATSEHGDLLDLIRIASGADSFRAALTEARIFLWMPALPVPKGIDTSDQAEAAHRLWRRCRPSTASMPIPI